MRIILMLLASMLVGCASIEETHYFKSAGDNPNYFKLTVDGGSGFSSSRYIAGYYDERALDLFLNEFSVKSGWPDTPPKLFKDQQKNPGTSDTLKPLDPNQHGRFAMILSTNADAIAETIGSFAESNVIADVLMKWSQKGKVDEIKKSESQLVAEKQRADAIKAELTGLVGKLTSTTSTEESFIRILEAISRGIGAGRSFSGLDEASEWLEGIRVHDGRQL